MSTFEGDLQRARAVGLDTPAAPDAVVSWSPWLVWWAILAVGIGLRVALFSGYGLGDDANYFAAYYGVFKAGSWSEHVPYDFRFSFWMPILGFFHIFGVTEWSWAGFVTLCSIVNLPLAFWSDFGFLGRIMTFEGQCSKYST